MHRHEKRTRSETRLIIGSDSRAARIRGLTRYADEHRDYAWLEVPICRTEEHPPLWVAAYRLANDRGRVVVAEVRVFPAEGNFAREVRTVRAASRRGSPFRRKRRSEMDSADLHAAAPPGAWSVEFQGTRAKVPHGGITSRLLRELRIAEHLRLAGDIERELEAGAPGLLADEGLPVPPATMRPPRRSTRRGRGRPRLSLADLLEVAEAYAAAVAAGHRDPVKRIAEELQLPLSTVRSRVSRARKEGLLAAGRHGVAYGELTAKGKKKRRDVAKRRSLRHGGGGPPIP